MQEGKPIKQQLDDFNKIILRVKELKKLELMKTRPFYLCFLPNT